MTDSQPPHCRYAVPVAFVDAAVIAVVVAAVFIPALGFPLLHGWDDNVYVTNNAPYLEWTLSNVARWLHTPCVMCYLPLTMYSYMVDYAIWELNPFGYHLQNLIWHVVAVLAFHSVLRGVGMPRVWALFGALVFAVHPQRVESVVWVSERKDVMAAAFFFLGLRAYLSERQSNGIPWRTGGLFLAAMLSKSSAICLPVVLALYDWHREGLEGVRRRWRGLALLAGVGLVFVPVGMAFQGIPGGETVGRLRPGLVAAHNLLWYAWKTCVPFGLLPLYPRLEPAGTSLVLLGVLWGAVAAVGVVLFRTAPQLLSRQVLPLVVAYVAALAPTCGIVPLGYVDMADRYSYLASSFLIAGIVSLLSHGCSRLPEPQRSSAPRALVVPAIVLLTGYWGLSYNHMQAWRSIRHLHAAACRPRPANVFALTQLGHIDAERADWSAVVGIGDRLVAGRRTWMSEAAWTRTLATGRYLRGHGMYGLGHLSEALAEFEAVAPHLERFTFHEPTENRAVHAMMAECYAAAGQDTAAARAYDRLLSGVRAGTLERAFYSGLRALVIGDPAQAVAHLVDAERLDPGNALVQQNLARARRALVRAGE